MPRFATIWIACCACSLLAAPTWAQGKGSLELGYDLGATYFLVDDEPVPAFGPRRDHDFFRLSFPVTPGLRFGYFLNDRDQLETRISFAALSTRATITGPRRRAWEACGNFPMGKPDLICGREAWFL